MLVVDDDAAIRHLLSWALARDYDVAVAGDGAQALTHIDQRRPDLLVLDLRMPVMDGWQLLARLEADGVDLPVVLMSGESRRRWPDSPLVRGTHDKLDDLDHLLATIHRVLAEADPGPPRP